MIHRYTVTLELDWTKAHDALEVGRRVQLALREYWDRDSHGTSDEPTVRVMNVCYQRNPAADWEPGR